VVSLPSPIPVAPSHPVFPFVSIVFGCHLQRENGPVAFSIVLIWLGRTMTRKQRANVPGLRGVRSQHDLDGYPNNFSSVFQDRALVVHKMSHCLSATPSYQHVLLGVDRRGSAPARTILAACIMKYDSPELVHLDTGSVNELPSSELFMKTSQRLFLVVGGHRSRNSRSPCGLQYHCPKAGERLVDCLPVLP
jgi:hypothetical protein